MFEGPTITLAQVPELYDSLASVPNDGHFAVVLFGEAGGAPRAVDALNLQFSVEGGRLGLDWVLLAPDNVANEERVHTFLSDRGFQVQSIEVNDVPYLRVEGANLPEIGQALLTELFRVTPSQPMYVIVEGFEWPQ
jgi:hypothetical protein